MLQKTVVSISTAICQDGVSISNKGTQIHLESRATRLVRDTTRFLLVSVSKKAKDHTLRQTLARWIDEGIEHDGTMSALDRLSLHLKCDTQPKYTPQIPVSRIYGVPSESRKAYVLSRGRGMDRGAYARELRRSSWCVPEVWVRKVCRTIGFVLLVHGAVT